MPQNQREHGGRSTSTFWTGLATWPSRPGARRIALDLLVGSGTFSFATALRLAMASPATMPQIQREHGGRSTSTFWTGLATWPSRPGARRIAPDPLVGMCTKKFAPTLSVNIIHALLRCQSRASRLGHPAQNLGFAASMPLEGWKSCWIPPDDSCRCQSHGLTAQAERPLH